MDLPRRRLLAPRTRRIPQQPSRKRARVGPRTLGSKPISLTACVKGFGRRPDTEAGARAEGPASESLRGRKPRVAEIATARGLGLWGFEGRAFGGARKSAGVVGVVGHVRGDLRGRIEGGSPGDGSTENRFGCGGRGGRERKHAAATSWRIMIVSEGGDRGGGHDVSILAASALKLRGSAPRANVSTTLMRPPQQGHIWGIANASARSALAASATPMPASPNGCEASSALASSLRRWAMLAARRGLANRP